MNGNVVLMIPNEFAEPRVLLGNAQKVSVVSRGWKWSDRSRLDLRMQLEQQGWARATAEMPADIATRRFRPQRTLAYFACLLHEHIDHVPGFMAAIQPTIGYDRW